jgi:DNA-binding response OmpR family regulator
MRQKLASWNDPVIEAEDLQEGFRKFQQETPDLVTLDVKLPPGGAGLDDTDRSSSSKLCSRPTAIRPKPPNFSGLAVTRCV